MLSSATVIVCSIVFLLTILLKSTSCQKSGGQPDEEKIRLYHYPNPLNTTERYDLSDVALFEHARLTKGKPIKIVVHGAEGHCFKDDVPFRLVQAYLRAKGSGREDYNVMCLDWGPLAKILSSSGSDANRSARKRYEYTSDIVSEKASKIILALKEKGYISSLDDVHIVGHSLGGQVSGFVGRKIQEKTGYQNMIGRITGLDIANVFIVYSNEVNLHKQLDLSDAKFVDIVHTSPIGLRGDYGHVDFYPDGGLHQRSCLTKGPISNVTELLTGGCSHVIVGKYWENSIDFANITACKDDSWESYRRRNSEECKPENKATFGEYVSRSARGRFFLEHPLIEP